MRSMQQKLDKLIAMGPNDAQAQKLNALEAQAERQEGQLEELRLEIKQREEEKKEFEEELK